MSAEYMGAEEHGEIVRKTFHLNGLDWKSHMTRDVTRCIWTNRGLPNLIMEENGLDVWYVCTYDEFESLDGYTPGVETFMIVETDTSSGIIGDCYYAHVNSPHCPQIVKVSGSTCEVEEVSGSYYDDVIEPLFQRMDETPTLELHHVEAYLNEMKNCFGGV